jgi:2-amino-4-hydroxy-6-hydroxymethyldihydropteridine diphosphokinase
MGRTATFRYGPRVIDLDILIFGDLVLKDPILNIPHPAMTQRAFVLIPLLELNPELRMPGKSRDLRSYLTKLDTTGVRPWSDDHA